jgi:lysyl-tRNA synthetase class 2
MKPEQNRGTDKGGDELTNDEGVSNALKLTEDEKLVLNLLKVSSPMNLNALKDQTGLSNKKWDKAIKGLTQHKLAKVEKTEEGLFVSLA